MSNYIQDDASKDGVDRRGFLKCMAWAGAGMVWVMKGGILQSRALGDAASDVMDADFTFAQVSDSHIGFNKGVYSDVIGTFQLTVDRINALPKAPGLVLHTGDLSHLSKPKEFDTVSQMIKSIKTGQTFFVPGEHDYFVDNGVEYLNRFGKETMGTGWHSFNFKGVHFVGLVKTWARILTMGRLRWDCWGRNSWRGWRRIWPGWGAALRLSCLRTCRCGRFMSNGDEGRRIARKR